MRNLLVSCGTGKTCSFIPNILKPATSLIQDRECKDYIFTFYFRETIFRELEDEYLVEYVSNIRNDLLVFRKEKYEKIKKKMEKNLEKQRER